MSHARFARLYYLNPTIVSATVNCFDNRCWLHLTTTEDFLRNIYITHKCDLCLTQAYTIVITHAYQLILTDVKHTGLLVLYLWYLLTHVSIIPLTTELPLGLIMSVLLHSHTSCTHTLMSSLMVSFVTLNHLRSASSLTGSRSSGPLPMARLMNSLFFSPVLLSLVSPPCGRTLLASEP